MQALARKIVVLGTGGTIAGTAGSAQDCLGYTSAQLSIGELLARVPGLPDIDIFNEQVAQIDSKDMHFDIWRRLALRCTHWIAQEDVRGVVIAHGTDTLEETAYFLHSVLAAGKPVVLTRTTGLWSQEMMQDSQNVLLVPPGNLIALQQAVSSLLADPGKRQRLGESARRCVCDCGDISLFALRLEQLAKQVVMDATGLPRG